MNDRHRINSSMPAEAHDWAKNDWAQATFEIESFDRSRQKKTRVWFIVAIVSLAALGSATYACVWTVRWLTTQTSGTAASGGHLLQHLDQRLHEHPEDVAARLDRAALFQGMHRDEQALADYSLVLANQPHN